MTVNLVRTGWQEKVEFVTELVDDPPLDCQPALLNQVFMNLIVDACQAIAAKYPGDDGKGQITIRTEITNQHLQISIADNGSGMTPEVQARVLESVFTTKTVGEGTGLRLSIAYGIVRQHGGELQITSTPGQGSLFTVGLPLSGHTT